MVRLDSHNYKNVMVLKHIWHNKAWIEFEDTLAYIHQEFGQHTTERVYNEVVTRVRQLCIFPKTGIKYEDLYYKDHEVRILHMRKASIIYCYDDETLFILSYWNNRRNPRELIELLSVR